jgi:hypothetical protein
MKALNKPLSPSAIETKLLSPALFKTSLRDWRARYQARYAAQTRISDKGYQVRRGR